MKNINIRKIILLIFNLLFYCFIDFKSFPVLAFLLIISYGLLLLNLKKDKKIWMIINIIFIVGTWVIYKSIINYLPLGLSFYSFKLLSLIIDNSKNKNNISFINYVIYATYFPQILSGPISRYDDIMNQVESVYKFNKTKFKKGLLLIVSGLFFKMVIANRTVLYVSNVFNDFNTQTGLALALAMFLYTIQIYCDFAGYSNISIGVSNLMGIDCKKNFDKPYFSASVKEFWNKWHISLSTWLRDYIYIPLGGNRLGKLRKYINSMITFLVSGFWHGNGTGYLFWGGYHGLLSNFNIKPQKRYSKFLCTVITFILVMIGWVFFRTENVVTGFAYLGRMVTHLNFSPDSIIAALLPFSGDSSSIALFLILVLFIGFEFVLELFKKSDDDYDVARLVFYIIAIVLFGVFNSGGFIYMNY